MYEKNVCIHCLQVLQVTSVSETKFFTGNKIQLVELYINVFGLNLLSCMAAEFDK